MEFHLVPLGVILRCDMDKLLSLENVCCDCASVTLWLSPRTSLCGDLWSLRVYAHKVGIYALKVGTVSPLPVHVQALLSLSSHTALPRFVYFRFISHLFSVLLMVLASSGIQSGAHLSDPRAVDQECFFSCEGTHHSMQLELQVE